MLAKTLLTFAGFNALTAFAFHSAPGTDCTGSGPCSYQYVPLGGSDADIVTVNAFCSPNGKCGENGASCQTSDNCYNYCATEGAVKTCGGLGALCNSQEPFRSGQLFFACSTPAYSCSADGSPENPQGVCQLGASQAARVKSRRAAHSSIAQELERMEIIRRAAKIVERAGDEKVVE